MKFKLILIIFSILTVPFASFGAFDAVTMADSAYSKGEYAKAIEIYTGLIKEKGVSDRLLYNMGNAYSKSGDYGNALLCYLRAVRLNPGNSQAQNNIKYIESKVSDNNRAELKGKKISVDPDSPAFFTQIKYFIVRDHTSNTWAIWAAASFVLTVICVALYIFTHNVLSRKIGFFGAFVCLVVSVITLIFALSSAKAFDRSDDGVIVEYKVALKTTPSNSAKDVSAPLTRGTRLWVLDESPADSQNPEWYKVRLNSDYVGWIKASDFQLVNTNR